MSHVQNFKDCTNICAVIPAHNSGKYIGKTLSSLLTQTKRPVNIIVIDDASEDDTGKKAEKYGAFVIRVNRKYFNATGTPLLALLINKGIQGCLERDADVIFISGSDDVFPRNYLQALLERMVRDNVVIASGRVYGEPYDIDIPRGAGRAIIASFIRKTGGYKPIYGWEAEMIIRAWEYGLKTRTYPQIIFYSIRSSARNPNKYYYLGRAMKELGYPMIYVPLRSIYSGLKHGKNYMYNMLHGYAIHGKSRLPQEKRRLFQKKIFLKLLSTPRKLLFTRIF